MNKTMEALVWVAVNLKRSVHIEDCTNLEVYILHGEEVFVLHAVIWQVNDERRRQLGLGCRFPQWLAVAKVKGRIVGFHRRSDPVIDQIGCFTAPVEY